MSAKLRLTVLAGLLLMLAAAYLLLRSADADSTQGTPGKEIHSENEPHRRGYGKPETAGAVPLETPQQVLPELPDSPLSPKVDWPEDETELKRMLEEPVTHFKYLMTLYNERLLSEGGLDWAFYNVCKLPEEQLNPIQTALKSISAEINALATASVEQVEVPADAHDPSNNIRFEVAFRVPATSRELTHAWEKKLEETVLGAFEPGDERAPMLLRGIRYAASHSGDFRAFGRYELLFGYGAVKMDRDGKPGLGQSFGRTIEPITGKTLSSGRGLARFQTSFPEAIGVRPAPGAKTVIPELIRPVKQ